MDSVKKMFIIGSGPGDGALVTPRALEAAAACNLLFATSRLGAIFPGAICLPLPEIVAALEQSDAATLGLIVSGDVGFYSLSKSLIEHFGDSYDIETIAGISSLQYLAAKINVPYDGIMTCSLHGREIPPQTLLGFMGKIAYNERVFVLTGGAAATPNLICVHLTAAGLGGVRVTVGENLSYSNERVVAGQAKELQSAVFSGLTVMLIENPKPADRFATLTDQDFIQADAAQAAHRAPVLGETIRSLVTAKLALSSTSVVYDICAGAGSVSVALSKLAYHGCVYAIEKESDALQLLRQNRQRHGAFNVEVLPGAAPAALESLPSPDAVFIGDVDGNVVDILHAVTAKNPGVRVVAAASTLQALGTLLAMKDYAWDILGLHITQARKVGGNDVMAAQDPVYIATLKSPQHV